MKKPILFAIIGTAAVLFVSLSSLGLGMQGRGPEGKDMGGAGVIWRLDLTDAQKAAINAREIDVAKEILPLKQSMRDLRYQLNKDLSSDDPDEAKILGLTKKISDVMFEIQKKNLEYMLWMRAQLSPEQKQKLKAIMQTRQGTEEAGTR